VHVNKKLSLRPFRFGLRSIFIVLTALCCWLAWEASVVRQRQFVLKEIRSKAAYQVISASVIAGDVSGSNNEVVATIPFMRRWLGDHAIQEIAYTRELQGFSEADLSRLARMFPEAKLREAPLLYEPCHPGCFPHGTLVNTPVGARLIESIAVGDLITTVRPDGQTFVSTVQSVFETQNRLWKVATDEGVLLTTQTQPLCLSMKETKPAGQIECNDVILRFENGDTHKARVLDVSPTNRTETVFNLILGNSEIFVAGGFLARSKPPAQVAVE
jgi:hypothetical protein